MNRQTVVDALDAAGNIGTIDDPTSTDPAKRLAQGHRLTYDKNGNRTSDEYWGNRVVTAGGNVALLGYHVITGTDMYEGVSYPSYMWNESITAPLVIEPGDPRLWTDSSGVVLFEYANYEGYPLHRPTQAVMHEIPVTYTKEDGFTREMYTYDALDRLSSVSHGAVNSVAGVASLVLDERSRQTVDIRGYDAAGRLIQSGAAGAIPSGYAAALNQGLPAGSTLGLETRKYRYDVGADRILSHPADSILSQGWEPTV